MLVSHTSVLEYSGVGQLNELGWIDKKFGSLPIVNDTSLCWLPLRLLPYSVSLSLIFGFTYNGSCFSSSSLGSRPTVVLAPFKPRVHRLQQRATHFMCRRWLCPTHRFPLSRSLYTASTHLLPDMRLVPGCVVLYVDQTSSAENRPEAPEGTLHRIGICTRRARKASLACPHTFQRLLAYPATTGVFCAVRSASTLRAGHAGERRSNRSRVSGMQCYPRCKIHRSESPGWRTSRRTSAARRLPTEKRVRALL